MLLALIPAVSGARGIDPHRLATGLASLGPRVPGSPAHAEASRRLIAAMRRAGLQSVEVEVGPGAPGWRNLVGVLPGASTREIVLSAHYDTVAGSPGAADDASGCGVALAAAAELARTPLQHTVRVVLFDGEEAGLGGSRSWVQGLSASARDRILAGLNLEMVGWGADSGGLVHTFPVRRRGRRLLAPGWLVHAALRAGETSGLALSMSDPRLSVFAQLALRAVDLRVGADSDSLLEAGVPAILLSDASLTEFDPAYHRDRDGADRLDPDRLAGWTTAVAATVRRLDALGGRPTAEDRYLVALGRVWLRRDLYWLGFLIWAALVFRGIPGRWRGVDSEERRHRGRAYLPGFAFRLLFLVTLLAAPVFAAVLLFPAALLTLLPLRRPRPRRVLQIVGLLPLAVLAAVVVLAATSGFVRRLDPDPLAAALVVAALAAFWVTLGGAPARRVRG